MERLDSELSLLEAMYPDQLTWNEKAREVKYTSGEGSFQLRLPSGYLNDELPQVLSAYIGNSGVMEHLKQRVHSCSKGEEIIDTIILAFHEIVEASSRRDGNADTGDASSKSMNDPSKATIIVWLHHLLNTNKRKRALSPGSQEVSGITKPGYPGVLIYSGPSKAVHEQVNELKQENWQAFQVRLETEEEWGFSHGSGVKEVEAMKDVVAEIGDQRKDEFMEAMRMK